MKRISQLMTTYGSDVSDYEYILVELVCKGLEKSSIVI